MKSLQLLKKPKVASFRRAMWSFASSLVLSVPVQAADVTIFAAASLKEALETVQDEFQEATGYSVVASLAGSSLLARQIELGAPADIFISANSAWMDYLEGKELLVSGAREDLLSNRLVLIAPAGKTLPIKSVTNAEILALLGEGRLAMALVEAVPAGIYGKASLINLGLWQQVEPQVAQTDNVRAALALVAAGETPLGIVYASDARAEPRVTILAELPLESYPHIRYPVALLNEESQAAQRFFDFLAGPQARAAFVSAGFSLISLD
nr:molybdate ABC transporter substrate-binding protein [Roseobacter sp. SK209-2-6]